MANRALADRIKTIADSAGIDALGYAEASVFEGNVLKTSPRRDPKLSMPDAETILVAGIYIGGLSLRCWDDQWHGRTSRLS